MRKFSFERIIILCLFIIYSFCLLANTHLANHDTRSFSLGEIHALSEEGINPAYLSISSSKEIGICVFNRFSMKELNTSSLYLNYPNKRIDYGARISIFGYSDYQIIAIQNSFAKKIFRKLSLGVSFLYINESSLLKEKLEHSFSSHLSCLYIFNEQLHFSFLCENILNNLPGVNQNYYSGIKYRPYENLSFVLEGSYHHSRQLNLSAGFEYFILDQFIIRSAIQLNPKTPSLGIAYLFSKYKLDAGFSLHSVLGISSSISFSYYL
ncbi:hypothetical protein LJB92_01040 [Bacteroidales bacterium OttesenSCG-928-M06]|nr:hypothetical protein [Bacteroidales bacterium OttesenSCG-928-M06]